MTTLTRDALEAYIWAEDYHQQRPDWDDILEKYHHPVAKGMIRMGLFDEFSEATDFEAEILRQRCEVTDALITMPEDLKVQIFERVLKDEGIF